MDHRFFLGSETGQKTYNGKSAKPDCWYFEPVDYDGDMIWSKPYQSRAEAEKAARDKYTQCQWISESDAAEYGRVFE